MPDFVNPMAIGALAAPCGLAVALWLVSLALRNVSIVDLAWPWFLVASAGVGFATADRLGPVAILVGLAMGLWAIRLGAHLARRAWRHPGEDARYAALRAADGPAFAWRSLVTIFLTQAVVAWMISAPVLAIVLAPSAVVSWPLIGVAACVFILGLGLETMADQQLARFKADPASAGRTLMTGIWALSRHPNYVGDALVWLAFGLAALAASHAPWAGLLGPALLILVMVRVTGPATERHLARTRPDYAAYRARVGWLPWPWPGRRSRTDSPHPPPGLEGAPRPGEKQA